MPGSDLYANLEWLPRRPADFRRRCQALVESTEAAGPELTRLARYALTENDFKRLAGTIRTLRDAGRDFKPLVPFKLGVLGNATLEPLADALIATAPRHGIALEVVLADYAQMLQTALEPSSAVNRMEPDAVLLAIDHRGLPLRLGLYDDENATAGVADSVAFITAMRDGIRKNSKAISIVQTVAAPPESIFGSFDVQVSGTPLQLAREFNRALAASVSGTEDVLFDVAALADTVGTARWHSPQQWNLAKLAFDTEFLPLYAEHVCRLIGALRGKSRRCLILDLDNTVWGGVIGDDGLEGISIAQGDATGEAFLEVQRMALALRERGIVLAVSSKNTDSVARTPFAQHPEMLLREHHFAVFQANWNDKATNIASIAQALNLGVDAMVFLDDNPVERGLVREALPAVAVPELPDDPALYARTLAAAGYFEAVAFSDEDRKRAGLYQDNARRVALQAQVADLPAYLASLDMEIVFKPFDATGRARIAQLINKSNQFNLTTRRYTEAEVAEAEADPNAFTLQVRLIDTFGDNGMIGVNVVRRSAPDEWTIDTWLMSCRVLGRCVEHMVLRELIAHARDHGVKRIIGTYIPTDRNAMVANHYEKLGFALVGETPDGVTTWQIGTDVEIEAAPMRVDRSAFLVTAP
jgi:FkbH-like protein